MNKVQSLILEVDSKRALLDDVRRKRRMAFSLGEDEPPVPQTLLQSTQVTMDKCEAMLAPPKEIVQPVVVVSCFRLRRMEPSFIYKAIPLKVQLDPLQKTENVDETAESVETTELPSAAPVELVDTADKTTTVPEPEDAGKSVPMTQQELIQLAKDLQRLSGEELQQVVIKSILKFHTLSVSHTLHYISSFCVKIDLKNRLLASIGSIGIASPSDAKAMYGGPINRPTRSINLATIHDIASLGVGGINGAIGGRERG